MHMTESEISKVWYTNRSLFSDHYLENRIPELSWWHKDVSEGWQRAQEIYAEQRDHLDGYNEAQTEDEFIRPVLEEVLEFSRVVQPSVAHRGRRSIPDYALYPDEEAKRRAEDAESESERFAPAVAVADAKYWHRPLDRHLEDDRDQLTHANPSFQIVDYLVATGIDWGILTNGNCWRLYYTQARSRIDTYYEADLERILEEGDEEAFRWFYLFFHSSAFVAAPQRERGFLDSVYEGSVEYGAALEKRLKDLIFEDVFQYLARGFLENWRGNGSGDPTQEELDEIYQGTLRLLYRILFLLHAEARGLLPVEDQRGYRRYSLSSIVREAASARDEDVTLSAISTDLWNDLESLFRIIDKGDPDLNVPRYNGGLFREDHPDNAFLEDHAVADKYLVPALDLLTREQKPDDTGRRPFLDYKTLTVRQLGSVYEGLLEFKLRQADQPLGVVTGNGREFYKALSQVDNPIRTVEPGELYLMNDKGERKATGSYYTPHYIVEYIVEHAVGPVLHERKERFRKIMDSVPDEQHSPDLKREAVETLLGLKVCDPAMGSGHFLVHATDWLAERLIVLLNEFPNNPLLHEIADVRRKVVSELERQGIDIDPDQLTDTGLLKRIVMKRCIYGVDFNPMAVELAKLSLWLDSLTVGAPLTFLDHHLKVGNSLIGTTVDEVRDALETEGGQYDLFTGPFTGLLKATEMIRELAGSADVTFKQVLRSASLYEDFESAMVPYKRILDLWVSRHFGNDTAEGLLRSHGEALINSFRPGGDKLPVDYQTTLEDARIEQETHGFFHWQLEFPEVYINLDDRSWKQDPGFDAVVTNPPYINAIELGRQLDDHVKPFWRTHFRSAEGAFDIYVLFIELCARLLTSDGHAGLITPNKYLSASYAAALREYLTAEHHVVRFLDVSSTSVFEVSVYPIVTILRNTPPSSVESVHIDRPSGELPTTDSTSFPRDLFRNLPDNIWGFVLHDCGARLLIRLLRQTSTLRELDGIEVSASSTAAESEEFTPYIKEDEDVSSARFRLINTGLIDRHSTSWGRESLTHRGTQHEKPVIQKDAEVLEQRRRDQYETPKLIVAKVALQIEGFADYDGNFASVNTNFIIPHGDKYDLGALAALLNSRLYSWIYRQYFAALTMQGGFMQFQAPQLRILPYPNSGLEEQTSPEVNNRISASDWEDLGLPTEEPSIEDCLGLLARRWSSLDSDRRELTSAFDVFTYIEKSAALARFEEVFSTEIKYGKQISSQSDLSAVHHDIDALRLEPTGDEETWLLLVQLKKRDPETDWEEWIKEEDGRAIAREWVRAFKLPMDKQKARYYQHAFRVLEEFSNFTSYAGGKTRSTLKKLRLTNIPAYDSTLDLNPLVELTEELEEVERKIELADSLIDQLVYQLYGITDDESKLVEEAVKR